jgi:ABC-type transport system involved in multi-copper enzyme maturation permease subunit
MSGVGAIRAYALRRSLRGFRLLAPLGIALLPTLVASVAVAFPGHGKKGFEIYLGIIVPLTLYFVLSFVAMFGMLPVLAELYAKGRVGYLYTRPSARWVPLAGLLQGAWLGSLVPLFVGAAAPALVLAIGLPDEFFQPWFSTVLPLCGLLALGSLAYGSVFLFLGVWSKQAVIWALGVSVVWGSVVGSLPGSMRNWSLHHYLLGLARNWCGVKEVQTGIFPPTADPPSTLLSLTVLFGVSIAFLFFSWRIARRRDVM